MNNDTLISDSGSGLLSQFYQSIALRGFENLRKAMVVVSK